MAEEFGVKFAFVLTPKSAVKFGRGIEVVDYGDGLWSMVSGGGGLYVAEGLRLWIEWWDIKGDKSQNL